MFARITALTLLCSAGSSPAANYDPLTAEVPEVHTLDLIIRDDARKRSLPVLLYLPASGKPAPVVIFSHGLGGSRHGSSYLGKHWAKRGYAAVFVQHPGSDQSVWADTPPRERMNALKKAAGSQDYLLRVKDIPRLIDQLTEWNAEEAHPLYGKLELNRIGMSGHSFGAVTTQAVSGQSAANGRISSRDPRIKATCAFSPSIPRTGTPEEAFKTVDIPWLLMTGTEDDSMIGGAGAASRLKVYPALPAGRKYELVLYKAEHAAFTERSLPGDQESRNPNHHRAVLALSTAFWDACLKDDPAALEWLNGDGPRTALEQQDRWQHK